MAKTDNLTDFLTDIADTIRAKKGITDKINPQNFSKEIAEIISDNPVDLSTDEEMLTMLTAENEGAVYRFTGVSPSYINGEIYRVIADTTKFPDGYNYYMIIQHKTSYSTVSGYYIVLSNNATFTCEGSYGSSRTIVSGASSWNVRDVYLKLSLSGKYRSGLYSTVDNAVSALVNGTATYTLMSSGTITYGWSLTSAKSWYCSVTLSDVAPYSNYDFSLLQSYHYSDGKTYANVPINKRDLGQAFEHIYSPFFESKTVTPTTASQTISPSDGADGLSKVIVEAVTAAIDANIKPENIRKGVTILGVTGEYEGASAGYSITFDEKLYGSGFRTSSFIFWIDDTAYSDSELDSLAGQTFTGVKTISYSSYEALYDYQYVTADGQTIPDNAWEEYSAGSKYTLTLTQDIKSIYFGYHSCLDVNTLVTMADGSTKRLGDIVVGDMVKSWDFENNTPINKEIVSTSLDELEKFRTVKPYFKLTFSDGTIIKHASTHRFYNVEQKAFVYTIYWNIGEHTYKEDGTYVSLVSREVINEPMVHGMITMDDYTCYFANGLMTGDRRCPTDIEI